MGEVTVDLDEEVLKQDPSSEPLPEPMLILMSPPPPFLPAPGLPAMLWPTWLKAFENYMKALNEKDLVESSKCGLLQNFLGPEGQRVFAALIQDGTKYTAAVSTLTTHFGSDSASQMHRLKFHQRAQMPKETAEEFVLALAQLVKPCNYDDLEDKLILDQLIRKTRYPQLRRRLLLQGRESLTLAEALVIGKEVETKLNRSQIFEIHEVSVDVGEDQAPPAESKVKRGRGRPRRGEERKKAALPLKRAPIRSIRHKDNYYYYDRSDRQYHSDNEAPGEPRPPAEDDGASSSPSAKEEGCDGAVNDENDEDFSPPAAQPKGPRCPICQGRRFRDANKLARHMRTHTKEKPYRCPLCAATFSQSYHMTRHLRSQHDAGPNVCGACGDSFQSPAKLLSHKRTHGRRVLARAERRGEFADDDGASDDETILKSEKVIRANEDVDDDDDADEDSEDEDADSDTDNIEDKEAEGDALLLGSDSKSESSGGGKRKEKGPPTSEKGHFCPICVDRRFRGPNKLARHMRTHTKEKPFSCPVCTLSFSQSYHMTRHVRNKHGLGQYICSKCGHCFASWLELKVHKRSHTDLTCLACDKQFKEKSALASHLKVHKKVESAPRTLVCGDCGKAFARLYHLKRHIVTHRKAATSECYTCPDCRKAFAFPEDLNRHLEVHLKENKGTCPKCNKDFGSMKELELHMEAHQKCYSCGVCGKKFKVEYALKKHEQGHQNEQYYCSLCHKHFLKLSHYKRHAMVHSRRETRCPHCDTVFLKLTALKYHLRTHTEERPFQCSCCVETFEEKGELEQHCLRHRKFKKERPYSCTRCDSAYSSLVELTEHMGSHEGEPPVTCEVCARSFLNKSKLEKHLSIHTGERPHLCATCGNGFPSAASLKLHAHIHTGERPFECPKCGKRFRSASGLRLHGRQHMEAPPSYECPECGRSYGRMTELKMHQRYHTGDKPYVCTCCSKRFISRDKLNVHMRIHTGERPYSCPHCGQTFTQTGDRNRHISKHHQSA